MDEHRTTFESYVAERYGSGAVKSKTVTRSKGERIVKFLRNDPDAPPHDPKFKHWIRQRNFQLVSCSSLGLKDVLCLPSRAKCDSDRTILSGWRRVAFVEEFFDILSKVHYLDTGHIGTKKTVTEVAKLYDCVPRAAVDKFVQLCLICHNRKPRTVRAPRVQDPIISPCFMTRGQMNLIDMRHQPDGTYKWIGHFMDHWSNLHVLFPLSRKCPAEVAFNLKTRVFSYIGTPRILHSDNGREFVDETISSLVKDWPGEIVIVNGRPWHPECQGRIEQGNGLVEKLLREQLSKNKQDDFPAWSEWLPIIQYELNTTVHETMETTPYELVFGQPPHRSVFPFVSCCIMEEKVEEMLDQVSKETTAQLAPSPPDSSHSSPKMLPAITSSPSSPKIVPTMSPSSSSSEIDPGMVSSPSSLKMAPAINLSPSSLNIDLSSPSSPEIDPAMSELIAVTRKLRFDSDAKIDSNDEEGEESGGEGRPAAKPGPKKRKREAEDRPAQPAKRKKKEDGPAPRKKKGGKEKDPNAPKKPLTAFMLWLQLNRADIKAKHPKISVAEIGKKAGEIWREMDDKSEWSRRAAEAKEEYQELMEEYKASGKAAAFEKKTAAASPAKGAKKSAKPKPKPQPRKSAISSTVAESSSKKFKSAEFVGSDDDSAGGEGSDDEEEERAPPAAKKTGTRSQQPTKGTQLQSLPSGSEDESEAELSSGGSEESSEEESD